jgi:ABC-type branched-subunit amino acid transport system ATPase component
MSLLEVDALSVHFGAVRACDGIDLTLEEGDLTAVVGPNGSGKTTLFRAICGDLKPARGTVRWRGRDITGWTTDRIARAGLVRTFQQSMAFSSETVANNLRMAAACMRGMSLSRITDTAARPGLPESADDILDFTGLSDVAEAPAASLPTGILRLVGIALTLSTRPVMLMLDEPAAGLNIEESRRLSDLLRRVHAAGVTLVVVDHDMSFILPLAQRLVVLDTGRKLMEGEPEVVRRHEDVVRVYLGDRFAHGKTGDGGARVVTS